MGLKISAVWVLSYAFLVLSVLWLLRTILNVHSNRKRLDHLGIHVCLQPVNATSPIWLLLYQRLVPLVKRLPFGLGSWVRVNYPSWNFEDKYRVHSELGDIFGCAFPDEIAVYVADPTAVGNPQTRQIVGSRKKFPKPTLLYKTIEVFGKNIVCAEGEDWSRHRRLTAGALNEQANRQAWEEALQQTDRILEFWTAGPQLATKQDASVLTTNVLIHSVFGMPSSVRSSGKLTNSTGVVAYHRHLEVLLNYPYHFLAIPHWILNFPISPRKWRLVGRAATQFKSSILQMLDEERKNIAEGVMKENLMSKFLRSSEADKMTPKPKADVKHKSESSQDSQLGMTDDELLGNLYFYNVAGNATMTGLLAYTIIELAAHPEWQEWVRQEVQHALQPCQRLEDWNYSEIFPKLKRCQAVMESSFEVLRLFPPITFIPKYTGDHAQNIVIHDRAYRIPANTSVYLNALAMQTDPRWWGADSLQWRPSRWIVPGQKRLDTEDVTAQSDLGVALDGETVFRPADGTYLPWSDGARGCPGRRFSEAVFVAVLASLLQNHQVAGIPAEDGEDSAAMKARLLRALEDSTTAISIQMRSEAAVQWVRL